jgi:hypothetical protein
MDIYVDYTRHLPDNTSIVWIETQIMDEEMASYMDEGIYAKTEIE